MVRLTQPEILNNIHNNMHYMCILCTIHASKLGDRITIELFLAVISYWTTGHVLSMGWLRDQKSTITMLVCCVCVRCKHLDSECVRCQETHQVKAAWKECKVYGIKIVRIFLGSYRIPNMVLQMSSVLGWHLWGKCIDKYVCVCIGYSLRLARRGLQCSINNNNRRNDSF